MSALISVHNHVYNLSESVRAFNVFYVMEIGHFQ